MPLHVVIHFKPHYREHMMWYFSWILGVGVALAFGIVNALWLEARRAVEVPDASQAKR